jgi:hypothetical protein
MRFTLLLASLALVAGCYNPALGPLGFYCHPDDNPACPDGAMCKQVGNDFRCVNTSGGVGDLGIMSGLIPKTGAPYTGLRNDPGLADVMSCPDTGLEPNDGDKSPVSAPAPTPDTATPKVTKMSICPKGNRPDTGAHDIDYFKVDTTTFTPATLTLMAEVFYDITYGDLDVGIFDSTGRLMSSDGSSTTNGCTAASITQGIYYVVVVGANNMDVNRYDLRIRSFSMSRTCPVPGVGDMAQ